MLSAHSTTKDSTRAAGEREGREKERELIVLLACGFFFFFFPYVCKQSYYSFVSCGHIEEGRKCLARVTHVL